MGRGDLFTKTKKVVLFPEISRVKFFLLPPRPHKSNVYENIYFLFQKNTHTNKKKFHYQIYLYEFTFSLFKQ